MTLSANNRTYKIEREVSCSKIRHLSVCTKSSKRRYALSGLENIASLISNELQVRNKLKREPNSLNRMDPMIVQIEIYMDNTFVYFTWCSTQSSGFDPENIPSYSVWISRRARNLNKNGVKFLNYVEPTSFQDYVDNTVVYSARYSKQSNRSDRKYILRPILK